MRKVSFLFALFVASGSAVDAQALNACDLNADGQVNILDAQLGINMALGLVPCTANVAGASVCNIMVVQRVTNAVLGGQCVVTVAHSVSLSWTASTSTGVVNYNVYRNTGSEGPYTLLASTSAAVTYTDLVVAAGETYYYVVTAVDGSGNESAYSNSASATIPFP